MNDPAESLLRLHEGQPVLMAGEALEKARAVMLMIHGRGASAEDILSVATGYLLQPGFAFLAPQAANHVWYPNRFMAPLESNEPWLSSSLGVIQGLISQVLKAGIPAEHILLLGFSQGACLALEYAARHPRRYGAIAGLSGALIGPDDLVRQDPGSLEGTPVFLGCSDTDPHVSRERVERAAAEFKRLKAAVTERLYPNLGHSINQDEIDFVKGLMRLLDGA